MIASFLVLVASLVAAGILYAVVHRRLGWVDIWTPAAGPALRPFADQIPLEDIQNGLYLLTDGSLVAGWELDGVDPEMQSPEAMAAQMRRFNHALNALSPSTEAIVQVTRSKDVTGLLMRFDAASTPRTPERLFLKRRWRRQLHDIARSDNTPFLDTRLRLFLRVAPAKRGGGPVRILRDLVRDVLRSPAFDPEEEAQVARAEYAKRLVFFDEETRGCIQTLAASPFAPRRLDNVELEHYAKSLLWSAESMATGYAVSRRPDPNRFLLADADAGTRRMLLKHESVQEYFPQTLRAQIASVEYGAYADHVMLDGRVVGVVRMFTAPGSVREDMMAGFRDAMQFPCTYTVRITPKRKQAELDRMRREAEIKMVQANTRPPGSPMPDQANVKNAEEAYQRYLDATAPDRNPFGVEITLAVEAASMDELKQRCERVQSYFLTLADARVVRERFGADRVFRESVPFCVPGNTPRLLLLTDEITCLCPFFSPWPGAHEPVRVFRTRSGEPWSFDPVDRHLTDRNQAHFGRTGSGKGVIGQLMTYYPALVKGDCDVLMIDSGGTYRRAARIFNGVYYEASDATPEAINALAIPPSYYTLSAEHQAEYLRAHLTTCVGFITTLADPPAQSESVWTAIISEVVTRALRGAIPERREVLLSGVYAALLAYHNTHLPERELEARRIAMNLRRYVHDPETGLAGQYARLFDRPQNFDPDTDFLVVDFNRVKKEDAAVLTAYLILVVAGVFVQRVMRNYARTDGRYTRWLGDEVADYLVNAKFSAEFMRGYREFRKFRAAADVMMQSYNDLSLDRLRHIGTPIKEAATTKIYTAHTRTDDATKVFRSDGLGLLADRVFELQRVDGVFAEAVVQQRQQSGVDRFADIIVAPDSFELWAATMHHEDTAVESAYWERYGATTPWHLTWFEHTYLMSRLWPHGVSNPATVTGIGKDRFPPDAIVRSIVQEARDELETCRRELVERGLLTLPGSPGAHRSGRPPIPAAPVGSAPTHSAAGDHVHDAINEAGVPREIDIEAEALA